MVAGFWTLDRTTITGRSAVILRQHTTPFRPMIVPFDDLELVYQSLRTLETPHTHKFPRVNAQDCRLGPIQPWDVKDFLRPGRGRGQSGNAGGDDRHDPIARELFHEQISQIGLYRIQRKTRGP
jgi:hypothetical protein